MNGSGRQGRQAQQGQTIMLKAVSAIAVAAALAGAAMIFPAMTPEVAASAPVPAAKTDRADTPASCERQGWPYYEANCLRDENRNAGRVPQIRIISTDRVHLSQPDAPVFEPMPLQSAHAELPANPLSVPAWPEYLDSLQVMVTR
jgi:hypothetical protein